MVPEPNDRMDGAQVRRTLENAGVVGEQAARFLDLLNEDGVSRAEWKAFLSTVDESPYGLADWVGALLLLADRISGEGRARPPIDSLFGYVGCCAERAGSGAAMAALEDTVEEAWATFGFAGEARG